MVKKTRAVLVRELKIWVESMMKVIKEKCLNCPELEDIGVRSCPMKHCNLYEYRNGLNIIKMRGGGWEISKN